MKKIATAFALVLALTAVASAQPRHHRPVANGTIDSGYSAPQNWNDIEVSVPSGGF